MKQSTEGTDGEIGFISRWEGNKDVGSGEQELKKLVNNEEVITEIRFFKPWQSQADGYFRMKDADANQTEVTWGFTGSNKIPWNIFMLFMNMDKAVGKDFNEGLTELKKTLENS